MSARFKVVYNVKHNDKSHDKYGMLMQRINRFQSFTEAVNFVRYLNKAMEKDITVIGKPVVEHIG